MNLAEMLIILDEERKELGASADAFLSDILTKPKPVLFHSGRGNNKRTHRGWLVASDQKADHHIVICDDPWQNVPVWYVVDSKNLKEKNLFIAPWSYSLSDILQNCWVLHRWNAGIGREVFRNQAVTLAELEILFHEERASLSADAAALLSSCEIKFEPVLLRSSRRKSAKQYQGWLVAGNQRADRYIVFCESPWSSIPEWFTRDSQDLNEGHLWGCTSSSSLKEHLDSILEFNALYADPEFREFINAAIENKLEVITPG